MHLRVAMEDKNALQGSSNSGQRYDCSTVITSVCGPSWQLRATSVVMLRSTNVEGENRETRSLQESKKYKTAEQ